MFTYTKLDSFHIYYYRFKLPEALLTSKPLDNFPLDECKPRNPCIKKKMPFCSCLRRFYNTDEHFYSSLIFCYYKKPPCTCQGFQISMAMRVSTRNGIGGPLSYKLEWIMAKVKGKMGKAPSPMLEVHISWEDHEQDLCLENVSQQVKKAEDERLVQPADDCHVHLEGGSAETKLRSNTLFHSGAPETEHGELKMTLCSSKEDHLALSVLVYFNTILLFKLEHSISAT